MTAIEHPVGVVLLGGQSRRMGVDKALIEVDGLPMAIRVSRALTRGGCRPVRGQGGGQQQLAALGLESLPDDEPGCGPVIGIATALSRYTAQSVVVAACDLAMLSGATVATVIEHGATAGRVTVAAIRGRRQLLSYWPAAAGDLLADLVAEGHRSYRGVLDLLDVLDVEVSADDLLNVNTPNDLADVTTRDNGPRVR